MIEAEHSDTLLGFARTMQFIVGTLSASRQWSEDSYCGPQRQLLFALANRIQNDPSSQPLLGVLDCLLKVVAVKAVSSHVHWLFRIARVLAERVGRLSSEQHGVWYGLEL